MLICKKKQKKRYYYAHPRGMWSVSVSHCVECGMEFPWFLIGQFFTDIRYGLYVPRINDFVI